MNFRALVLASATILAFCVAIVVQILVTNPYVTIGAWLLTAAFAVGWVAANLQLVSRFLKRKSTHYGASVALVLFLVLGILVFVNVLAKQHPWRKDITRAGANTLSEQSEKVLAGLNQEVTAFFFASLADKDKGEDLLKRYAYDAKNFKYEFVDVDRNPTRAAALGVKRKNTVVLSLGPAGQEGAKRVLVNDATEEGVTNGLIKLLRSNEVAVYFTVGHEEHPLAPETEPLGYASLKAELEKQGYTVKELNLFTEGKVPSDAAVVIVGGPHKSFFPKELEVLGAWIRDGGHALVAVDVDVAAGGLANGSRQLVDVVKPFGVNLVPQMLVDPLSQNAKVDPSVILGFAGAKDHPITKDFPHSPIGANFMFPLTAYLTHAETVLATISPLAVSSPQAWAVGDWVSLKAGKASFVEGRDRKGPLDLGYAVEGKKPESQAQPGRRAVKLVVFADALFATNSLLDKVGNRDLILNSVGWLADDDKFLSIRPKEDQDAVKQFNVNVINLIFLVTVFLVPLLLAAMGGAVWWRRSKL